jgi:hypothetical protein
MALTRNFTELVQTRIAREPALAVALLREGAMLTGDFGTSKAILRAAARIAEVASHDADGEDAIDRLVGL